MEVIVQKQSKIRFCDQTAANKSPERLKTNVPGPACELDVALHHPVATYHSQNDRNDGDHEQNVNDVS